MFESTKNKNDSLFIIDPASKTMTADIINFLLPVFLTTSYILFFYTTVLFFLSKATP